jgi:hypothetical protein
MRVALWRRAAVTVMFEREDAALVGLHRGIRDIGKPD